MSLAAASLAGVLGIASFAPLSLCWVPGCGQVAQQWHIFERRHRRPSDADSVMVTHSPHIVAPRFGTFRVYRVCDRPEHQPHRRFPRCEP